MSNSPLVNHVHLSPNYTPMTNKKNEAIVIHHMAGKLTVEQCGNVFAPSSRKASSNYGVDNDGRIGMYVEEKNRSWASSSKAIDSRAITIEVANSATGGNWPVSDKAMASLINLCVDICKRNGIKRLNYTGDKSGNLQMHKWYAATGCPGPYLESKFPYIANEVNKRLGGSSGSSGSTGNTTSEMYRVRKTWADAASQKGAFTNLENAKKCANQNPGYKVFNNAGQVVYGGTSTGNETITKPKLTVDGKGGPSTIKKAQEVFGTTVDGKISNQLVSCKPYLTGFISSCIDWDGGKGGSVLVKAIQRWAGVPADGYWGRDTSIGVQKKIGVPTDGYFGPNSMRAFQQYLNTK